jgi:hypothetical protein
MKKLFLTLIVVLAYVSSAFAQGYAGVNPNDYESHWPEFNYHDYLLQVPFVAAITIDGQTVSLENNADNWSSLEVAAFVINAEGQEECRSNHIWLTDEYVLEYGDPYLTIDGFPIYYNPTNPGGTVHFKMYDHLNNIEYTECTITYLGDLYTVNAGEEVAFGWGDGEEPVMLNFTTPVEPTCGIVLDENNEWKEYFDNATFTDNTNLNTSVQHDVCWTWTRLVELPAGLPDTLPQLVYNSNFAHSGDYSLMLWNRGVYAMPKLDENIDLNELKMSFYVRQSYPFYSLLVGVMDEPDDPETFVPVAFVDNGESTGVEYFELNFANYTGEGRYIAFKNVRPSATSFDGQWSDFHSVNYIDDITISLMGSNDCALVLNGEANDFESETSVTTKLTGAMPECWEFVQSDVENMPFDKMPQLYYQASVANSGDYSFRMVNRGIVALPELNEDEDFDIHHVRVLMNVRQPNKNYQLQVGVWEPVPGAEGGYFVPVALVNNATTDYEFVECGFSNYTGNGTRIAFRNVLGGGMTWDYSYNYIDDIAFVYVDENCQEVDEAYTEDFDNVAYSGEATKGVAPDCWDVVAADVEMSYDKYPQVYFNETFANSGSYSLRMVDRCVYAMPELGDVELSEYTLNFYLRQPNPLYQLEVGVWEVNYDESQEPIETFVPVATFNNENDEPVQVSCDFAEYEGFGNRIAFRNTLKNGRTDLEYSYNYIDDVQLVLTDQAKNNVSSESVIDAMGADQYLESIAVYPNPTVGELHIGAMDVQKVECYNQMGQLVAVYDNESNISLNSLANGVYTLRITVPQGVTMRKVVKK